MIIIEERLPDGHTRQKEKLVQIGKPRPGVTPVERAPRCPEKIPDLE